MATATAKRPARIHCEEPGCTYSVEAGQKASLTPHKAMAHGGSARNELAPGQASLDPDPPSAPDLTAPVAAAPVGDPAPAGAVLLEIPLELVDVGDNVRVTLEAIDELAASIAEHGVLQPVKATLLPDGRYRLLWGQRRVLAARQAGLATIPALVSTDEPDDRPIEQLVENLHRADLNPIDRAQAMRAVVDAGVSQADLARKLGIAPSTVANDLRILTLDPLVVEQVRSGAISASHGKAMVGLPAKDQRELGGRITAEKLPAHRIESELQWRRQAAEAEEAKAKRTEKAIPKLLAALEAAGIAKDVPVNLRARYDMESEPLRKAIAAAGWPLFDGYPWAPRPPAGKCDCTVVTVEFDRVWKVTPACGNDNHRDRQRNVDNRAEQERRKAIEARVAELRVRVRAMLEDVPVVLLLLAHGDTWSLPTLVEKAPDTDPAELRDLVADVMAQRADASRIWNDRREPMEKALEALIAMLPEATS